MSKLKLKKELNNMSREQLIDIILSAYDARKETKEYFEFFINPDVFAMMTKLEDAIIKECRKGKRGYAKFRISQIKNINKDFQGLNPGPEYVVQLMLASLVHLVRTTLYLYVSDAQYDSIIRFAKDTLAYADKTGQFPQTVTSMLELANSESLEGRYIRHALVSTIEDYQTTLNH